VINGINAKIIVIIIGMMVFGGQVVNHEWTRMDTNGH
jgi:hypothetical protein